jgi:hypothetical protein
MATSLLFGAIAALALAVSLHLLYEIPVSSCFQKVKEQTSKTHSVPPSNPITSVIEAD